jgi:F-box interacting protein
MKIHLKRSIETNRDRTIIYTNYNHTDPSPKYFSVSYLDENRFSKAIEIKPPLSHDFMETDIVGCYGGLVCIQNKTSRKIVIWNPVIRSFRKLPPELPSHSHSSPLVITGFIVYAFGYDPHKDDYKVLRLLEFCDLMGILGRNYEVQLYSLRSNSWKKIKQKWPNKFLSIRQEESGTCFNGAFHWLIAPPCKRGVQLSLVGFNLATEKFKVFRTPFQPKRYPLELLLNYEWCERLEVLGGHLCFIRTDMGNNNEVWMMKKYGIQSSWSRIYKIAKPKLMMEKPLIFSKDCKKLMLEEPLKGLFEKKVENQLDPFKTATCIASLHLLEPHHDVIEKTPLILKNQVTSFLSIGILSITMLKTILS